MISRSSTPKQIEKGGKMPKGKGTYGSKIGRPPKKYKKGGTVMDDPSKGIKRLKPRSTDKKKKTTNVNTPGEAQRAFQGRIDHMISKAEGEFKKMIKNFRTKTR